MAEYLVGVDIGGTFTDCVIIDEAGRVTTAKAPSTPDDFARGMLDAMAAGAAHLGLDLESLCRRTRLLTHGTTVGTNAVVQKRGARVGLITTKGHSDVIHIMRGSRGFTGRELDKVVHFPESRKPDPLVPKTLVEGISERVDCFGAVVVPLNEAEAEAAIERLLAKGVEAIAVCFLWSFKHPEHERRVRDMVRARAPGVFVTCSADLVPKWGEYERTTAVAINAYIGPVAARYLQSLDGRVRALGYARPMQITQCGGGTISVARACDAPLLTLDSGPVSGVTGSAYLGALIGCEDIITTDMGGTSFDVGIIRAGQPSSSYVANVNQYECFLPKVDIQAIGNGGGSLVRADAATRTLRVGPDSAGADPGPVCYGKGGTVPTVTDAALVLGYIAADSFAGGSIRLDRAAAEAAIAEVGRAVGLDTPECAAGICRIAEHQMADLIRRMTVQKGYDPRDFTLFAFGGAGPMHAGVFAFELGVERVIVPQGKIASTWCAFGAASADVLHVGEQVDIMVSPFEARALAAVFAALKHRLAGQLREEGISESEHRFRYSLDLRHKGQINEVEIEIADPDIAAADLPRLQEDFYRGYERLYGKGSSFRGARLEAVTFRVRASAATPKPALAPAERLVATPPAEAGLAARPIWWSETRSAADTPAFRGEALLPGNRIDGPAVIETTDTTVVVHPGRRAEVDAYGNIVLTLKG